MELQAIYDKIKNHLLTQNERSMCDNDDGEEVCAYRGEEGRMCAVGVLISDKAYTPYLEDKAWSTKEVAEALCKSGIAVDYFDYTQSLSRQAWLNADPVRTLLQGAQDIHDTVVTHGWKIKLEELADELGLNP